MHILKSNNYMPNPIPKCIIPRKMYNYFLGPQANMFNPCHK